ncbi:MULTISPECIES: nitrite reductase small subunit NirD [unclassified Hyphomonas]|uniref:nitrite reductase small subunit NirD n=1 Tax=unclassified Hyphomonas TaxID=2630699 RepID=UPI000458D5B8|nr:MULTISPECIES: nitrite reductase small subunit NirD [unclassified Hyphomonas]KCZ46666.1 hypothetical protein HY17_07935 [Hyphomonas sp. CY54-11-8]
MDGSGSLDRWYDICALEDIPVRGSRRVGHAGGTIGVFRTAGQKVFAADNKCPHRGGPLSEGIVHDSAVTCPLHGWVFDLETGAARGADEGCLKTYPVEVREDGRIWIRLPAC